MKSNGAHEDDEENEDEMGGEGGEFMKDFFEEVNAIKTGMAVIRRNIRAIEESYSQSLVAVGAEQGASKCLLCTCCHSDIGFVSHTSGVTVVSCRE